MRSFLKRGIPLPVLLNVLVTAAVLMTAAIMLFASYHSEQAALKRTHLSINESNAEKLVQSIDTLFTSMDVMLRNVSLLAENTATEEAFNRQLDAISQTQDYFNELTFLSSRTTARASFYTTERNGRQALIMEKEVTIANGTQSGLLVGVVNLQHRNALNELIGKSTKNKDGSYYFIADAKGKVMYHPDHERIGKNIPDPLFAERLIRQQHGSIVRTNDIGDSYLTAFAKTEAPEWYVIVQTPYLFIQNQLVDHMQLLLFFTMIPFISLLLLSNMLARKAVDPFIQLTSIVRRLAAGEYVTVPKRSFYVSREAEALSRGIQVAVESMQQNQSLLRKAAVTDPLTGLFNRRKMDEMLTAYESIGRSFSVTILDIDHFKSINDTYGHQTGDTVLKQIAELIQHTMGKERQLFRIGGEEFLILFPDLCAEEAFSATERIRLRTASSLLVSGRPITFSAGIASYPLHAESTASLLHVADEALYVSKTKGRNRTTLYTHKELE